LPEWAISGSAYYFFFVVIVIRHETTTAARWGIIAAHRPYLFK